MKGSVAFREFVVLRSPIGGTLPWMKLFTQALGLSPPGGFAGFPVRGAIHFAVECQAVAGVSGVAVADQPIHDRIADAGNTCTSSSSGRSSMPICPVACAVRQDRRQVSAAMGAARVRLLLEKMEAIRIAPCQAMPAWRTWPGLVGVSDDRVWRLLRHHIDQARAREDYSTAKRVAADETSSRRGQRYITLFHDADVPDCCSPRPPAATRRPSASSSPTCRPMAVMPERSATSEHADVQGVPGWRRSAAPARRREDMP